MLCSVVPQQTFSVSTRFSVSNSLFSCISVLEKPTFDDVDALVANINETQTVCTPKTSAKASTKTSFSTTFTDPGKKKVTGGTPISSNAQRADDGGINVGANYSSSTRTLKQIENSSTGNATGTGKGLKPKKNEKYSSAH